MSGELLQSVPIAILTGLGAYGGFPQPPKWWKRLSRFKLMNYILVWVLIYQGGGGGNIYLTTAVSLVIFIVMEVSKIIEGDYDFTDDE